jgi:hypothetical protein
MGRRRDGYQASWPPETGTNAEETGKNPGTKPQIPDEIHAPRRYTLVMSDSGISFDEFQALEQKVLRAVEIVKREREARAAAETEVEKLRAQLAAQSQQTESQVTSLNATLTQEREAIRQRIEGMLSQMDELL